MQQDYLSILTMLQQHRVRFVLVGAMSVVVRGSPLVTFDLDVVHDRSPDNIDRLLGALDALDATYRGRAGLRPTRSHLESRGHQLLMTTGGPFDVLGEIEDALDYDALRPYVSAVELGLDEPVEALTAEKYLELKERSPREKDRARLPELRALCARLRGQG